MKWFFCLVFLLSLAWPMPGQGAEAAFEPAPCPFEGAADMEGVDCGVLIVPERRDITGGRNLRLMVAVLRSHSPDPAPDPVVFLSGGPGIGSVEFMPGRTRSPFWDRLRQERDLVFFDQRGTGYSEPTFCPEMEVTFANMAFRGLPEAEMQSEKARVAAVCSEQMLAQHVDLTAYHSAASADDIADLRRALGYETWNIFGLSYGTRLALMVLRDVPDGVRSVILDSASPPDVANWVDAGERFSGSLQRAFDQCHADPECRAAFPSLEDDFYEVIADLEAEPIVFNFSGSSNLPDGELILDGKLWAQGIFNGFYDRSFVPVFPLVVQETKRRNLDTLRVLTERIARDPETLRRGMHYAVNCYEVAPFNPPDEMLANRREYPRLVPYFESASSPAIHDVCDAWHDARANTEYFRPVRSDVPALIFGGEFDPITPPGYGRQVARTLPNSTFVEVPAMGHAVSPFSACTRDLLHAFLEAPGRPLDTACVAELPKVSFVTDVYVNGGVSRFASALQSETRSLFVMGGLGLLLLSAVLGWPVAALVGRLRGHRETAPAGRAPKVARVAAATAAGIALVFLVGLVVTVRNTAAQNPYVLAFGVPREAAWLFALPWVMAVLTIGTVALAISAWPQRWWTRAARIHYGLVATACTGFVIYAATWGFI